MNGSEILSVLNRIAATSSRSDKEAVLEEWIDDQHMQRVLRYAYDPFMTFGITPVKPVKFGTQSLTLESPVWGMLESLACRRLTGNAAAAAVADAFDRMHSDDGELLWRILSKDLRCGITEKTINKVKPGLITVFSCMLAHPFEHKRVTTWPVVVEPKLDGFRLICVVQGDGASFYSRTGKPFPAVDHLGPDVVRLVAEARAAVQNPRSDMSEKVRNLYWLMLGGDRGQSLALDCEVVSGQFNETSSQVRRKSEQAKDAVLHVFDAAPAKLFLSDQTAFKASYNVRRQFAEFVVGRGDDTNRRIRMTERYLARSIDEVMAYYEAFRARGLEGAMVKPLDGIYVKKRSHSWMKLKAEETIDAPVIGVCEGEGKYAGKLGGLIVSIDGVEVRVGGGFSDAQREQFWKAAQEDLEAGAPGDIGPVGGWQIFGRMIEIEYHEKTPDGALRHPRFVRFRDDKQAELEAA